jgi:pyruvate kinase
MKRASDFFKVVDFGTGLVSEEQIREKRVKIVGTIGPASESPATIEKMIDAGLDVARLNFSHGQPKDHARRIRTLREVSKRKNKFLGILADIQGPKIRIGRFTEGKVELKKGQKFIVTTELVMGDSRRATCSYRRLHEDIKPGHRILLDDGLILLLVQKVSGRDIHTEVVFGGPLKDNKGINLPDTRLKVSCLTDKDRKDIQFAIDQGVDFIALSFISDASDIRAAKKLLKGLAHPPPIVAKIETQHAVKNLAEIVAEADGLMVARGDLGVECPMEMVPRLQKQIIQMANQASKFVITATQMLESMTTNPRPTRAEASDVANAVLDGTDAVMLSAETASGAFPVEAVKTMSRIIVRMEEDPQALSSLRGRHLREANPSIAMATTAAAVQTAENLKATALISFTHRGSTAINVSRFRPFQKIIALCPFEMTCRRLSVVWGVKAFVVKPMSHTDDMPKLAKAPLKQEGLWKNKSKFVMLSGTPILTPGTTNLLKVYEVKS